MLILKKSVFAIHSDIVWHGMIPFWTALLHFESLPLRQKIPTPFGVGIFLFIRKFIGGSLPLKQLDCLLQMLDDGQILGALALTLAAADAGGGQAVALGGELGVALLGGGEGAGTKLTDPVVILENVRDGDLLGAAVHAVAAGGAGHGGLGVDDIHHLFQKRLLLGGDGLEMAHKAEVVRHLLRGGHAAEDHAHIVQGRGEANGPGGRGGVRVGGL